MSQAVEKIKHLTSELTNTKSSLAASQKDNETLRAQVTHTEALERRGEESIAIAPQQTRPCVVCVNDRAPLILSLSMYVLCL